MNFQIKTERGGTEAIINSNCEFSLFEKAIDILENQFNIHFLDKINDFDSYYWHFNYNSSDLILHYNVYMGLSIYPSSFKEASKKDNENTIKIGQLLFDKI